MIRKRPEKDTVNPPGQIRTPVQVYDPVQHNIEQWKKWAAQKNAEKYPVQKEQERVQHFTGCLLGDTCVYPQCQLKHFDEKGCKYNT